MSQKSLNEELKKKIDEFDLKAKVDELDLDSKLAEVQSKAEKIFHDLSAQVSSLAAGNETKVSELLDKAGALIDERTGGKYTDQVAKIKGSVAKGVHKLAESGTPGEHAAPVAGDEADVWSVATDEPVGGDDNVAGPVA